MRCILGIQVKMQNRQLNMNLKVSARNTNLRVIRILIDSICSYGTVNNSSEDRLRREEAKD